MNSFIKKILICVVRTMINKIINQIIVELPINDLEYKPFIKAKQIKGLSIPCVIVDYKTKRQVELLSQVEKYYWYQLRFEDDTVNIYEQYPLNLDLTLYLAELYSIKHPKDKSTPMTTDFLVETRNGYVAYSVKSSEKVFDKARNTEKQTLERLYWESLNVKFRILVGEKLNMDYINNIMDVVSCYDSKNVFSKFDLIRYLIAHKKIIVDLESERINYSIIMKEYFKDE